VDLYIHSPIPLTLPLPLSDPECITLRVGTLCKNGRRQGGKKEGENEVKKKGEKSKNRRRRNEEVKMEKQYNEEAGRKNL
jgi:hypothetical protein